MTLKQAAITFFIVIFGNAAFYLLMGLLPYYGY